MSISFDEIAFMLSQAMGKPETSNDGKSHTWKLEPAPLPKFITVRTWAVEGLPLWIKTNLHESMKAYARAGHPFGKSHKGRKKWLKQQVFHDYRFEFINCLNSL